MIVNFVIFSLVLLSFETAIRQLQALKVPFRLKLNTNADSSFCCEPLTPSSHEPSPQVVFEDLPTEIKQRIFSSVSSIQDVSKCSRVCKDWSHLVQETIIDFKQYSSAQHYLVSLLESEKLSLQQERALSILESSPSSQNMCRAPLNVWLHVAAKYGHVKALEKWFQEELKRNRPSLEESFSLHLGTDSFAFQAIIEGSEDVLLWYIDKLEQLGQFQNLLRSRTHLDLDDWERRKDDVILNLFRFALGEGMDKFLNHPALQPFKWHILPFNGRTSDLFLDVIGQGSNKTMWRSLLSALPNNMDNERIVKGLCHCKQCDIDDVRMLLGKTSSNSNTILNSALPCAITVENHLIIPLLIQVYPNPAIARLDVESELSLGMVHFAKKLLTLNPGVQFPSNHQFKFDPVRIASIKSLEQYVRQSPSLTRMEVETILARYAFTTCGNAHDIAIIRDHLIQQREYWYVRRYVVFDDDRAFVHMLTRNQISPLIRQILPLIRNSRFQSRESQFPRFQPRCHYKDALNFIKFLVTEMEVRVRREDLALAMVMGRLDIFQWLYEQYSLEIETPFALDIGFLGLCEQFRHYYYGSFQEPAVIDYIVDKIKQDDPNNIHRFLTRLYYILQKFSEESREGINGHTDDCYLLRVKHYLSAEHPIEAFSYLNAFTAIGEP